MKFLKTLFSILLIPFGVKSNLTDEMVDEGICDFGGQGKNKYGR